MNIKDFYDAGLFLPYEKMGSNEISEVKYRLIDTILAMIGGALSAPEEETERVCAAMKGLPEVRPAYPAGMKTSLENAGFLNGWFIRHADWGDTYRRNDDIGGHPSDMIGAVLALAELPGMSGKRLIEATWFSYQLYGVLQEFMLRKSHFLDYTTALSFTVPLIAAICNNATEEEMQNALNAGITGGVVLSEVRHGKTTNLKCGASAYQVYRGLWCYRLTNAFLETPDGLFTGKDGWLNNISSFEGDIERMKTVDVLSPVEIKEFPCFHVGQGPAECAIALHDKVKDHLDEIESVKIYVTKEHSAHIMKPSSIAYPVSQAAADHNVKYGVSIGLQYGALTPLHYRSEFMDNETTHRLFDCAAPAVYEDAPVTHTGACKVEVRLKDGTVFAEAREHGSGSFSGLSFTEREAKFGTVLARKQKMLEQVSGRSFAPVIDAVNDLENGDTRKLIDAIQGCLN